MRRRFVQIAGELIEIGTRTPTRVSADVRGDIKPYKSMITGEMITSRSKHREHLLKHGCQEVGNDRAIYRPMQNIPDAAPQQRKELIRAQIDSMSHAEFKSAIKRDVDRVKWNSREH